MAAAGGDGGSGGGGWVAQVEPDFRLRVVETMVRKMAGLYRGQRVCREKILMVAANHENRIFNESSSMDDYIQKISTHIAKLEASGLQQQMKMRQQMRPPSLVQAVQGGNSFVPAMPQEASKIAVSTRLPSQLQGIINVKQEQSCFMPMVDQIVNYQPGEIAPLAPVTIWRNQPGQRVVQSVGTQSQAQILDRQPHFAGFNTTNVALLQGQSTAEPNAQQNHLLRQDASYVCVQPALPFQIQQQRQLKWMNHQAMRANQKHNMYMYMQRHQMYGSQQKNVAGMQIGHPRRQNNQQIKMFSPDQPIVPPQQRAVDQQSTSSCLITETSTTTGSVGGVDWREEMFRKIRSLKDAYFSELTELDRSIFLRRITQEQFQSLPKDQADRYRITVKLKAATKSVMNFLQLEKSSMHEGTKEKFCSYRRSIYNLLKFHRRRKATITEMNANGQPQNFHEPPRIPNPTGEAAPSTGGTRNQKNRQEQPAEKASTSESTPTDIDDRTPSVSHQIHTDELVGLVEDEVSSKAETEAAAMKVKVKPINRLIDGTSVLSPAASEMHSLSNFSMELKRAFDDLMTWGDDGSLLPGTGSNSVTPSSSPKRQKTQDVVSAVLDEIEAINGKLIDSLPKEIEAINGKLIDTEISIDTIDKDGGAVIIFSYTLASLAPDMKRLVTASGTYSVKSVRLFVPDDYPRSSPVLLHGDGDGSLSEISGKVDASFKGALRELPAPMSIEHMARAWDVSVRRAMIELAHRHGGGTFSSRYGHRESCPGD
ncbi:hypothetical protein ABZP36_033476 [Zizania latifolia]